MIPVKTEVQNFRHRGFKAIDGSINMIFGNDPEPINSDGTAMLKLWDHDMKQVITVSDHVEPS